MNEKKIPKSVIERIPLYADYLNKLIKNNIEMISSTTISQEIGLGEVQVRKDLNLISGNGKPKVGYQISELKSDIEKIIHQNKFTNVIIIGAGKIGCALANFEGFKKDNFNLIGIFDNDLKKIGQNVSGLIVKNIDELSLFCKENQVSLAILSVPSFSVKDVSLKLEETNIKGVLNFSNAKVENNNRMCVKNVDIVSLLMMLAVEINNN